MSENYLAKIILVTEFQKRYFRIRHSDGNGGKAGKGCNATSSFTVVRDQPLRTSGYISYTPGDRESEVKSLRRAVRWLEKELSRAMEAGEVCDICGDPDCRSDHK